jgi:hypothetical protein
MFMFNVLRFAQNFYVLVIAMQKKKCVSFIFNLKLQLLEGRAKKVRK